MNKVRTGAAVILLSLLLTLTACGNDEAKIIVGTWKQNPGDAKSFMGIDPVSHYYTFNSDGTYKESGYENFSGKTYDINRTGKYTLDTKERLLKFYPDDGWHNPTFGDQEFAYSYTLTNDYLSFTTGLGTENYTKQK